MENKRPQQHITLLDTKGEEVSCTVATPTIKRKAKYREIERLNAVKATQFNEINAALLGKGKLLETLQAEKDSVGAKELQKEIEADLKTLSKMDKEAFDRQIEQVQLIINIPSDAGKINWDEQDNDELDKASLFFWKLA